MRNGRIIAKSAGIQPDAVTIQLRKKQQTSGDGCTVSARRNRGFGEVIPQHSAQPAAGALEGPRYGRDSDAVQRGDGAHGHAVAVIVQQIPPLTVGQLLPPAVPQRSDGSRALRILAEGFLSLCGEPPDQSGVEVQRGFSGTAFLPAYDCTSCAA